MAGTTETEKVFKEGIRKYFFELTCNLRVLGSQLGLEPYELDDLTQQNKIDREALLEECFIKGKLTSWQELVNVLKAPSLDQHKIADEITRNYNISGEQSPLQSLSQSMSHSGMGNNESELNSYNYSCGEYIISYSC